MESASWSRWFERLGKAPRAKNGCVRTEAEVDYIQLCVEAAERVQELTSPEHSGSLHLNGAQCGLLADALSKAVGSAKQETHSMDDASVRLCGPAFRELCRVAGDCEKLVRDCCNRNWLAVAILLADSKEDFLLRVSELEWCSRAWRTIMQHGLQGGTWLEQFHKSSKMSVGNRRADRDEDTARLKRAAEEDLRKLLGMLVEVGEDSVEKQVRELARHVLSRCEMLGGRPDGEQIPWRSEYELPKSGDEFFLPRQPIGAGGSGKIWRGSWFGEAFAFKSNYFPLEDGSSQEDGSFQEDGSSQENGSSQEDGSSWKYHTPWREVANMIKTGSHPRTVRLLGVYHSASEGYFIMELMPSDLHNYIEERMRRADSRCSIGDRPFALHVALDIMLQVAEGIEVLHKLRIFHRDLKSMNVLVQPVEMIALREEGYVRVKLTDFGLSGPRSDFSSAVVGTRRWMAPEISSESEEKVVYGAKADAFSFGVMCYEILSGEIPFQAMAMFGRESIQYVEGGGRPELPANLPSQIASLVRRCWDKEPTNRPSFTSICKELRYLKFLLTIGGETQFRALDVPDEDAKSIAAIVKDLPWIEHGKLRFIRHVGSGGFGSVDECEVQGEGRVAVKNLLRCSSKVRVEEEAALLVRVQHRNVVKLVACAFNEEERRGMIVMELMGQDLHSLISKLRERSPTAPPFPLAVALGMMLEVATAMKHIRSCNVLHRDLKTTNILVNVKERMSQSSSRVRSLDNMGATYAGSSPEAARYDVKLADFGLSKYKSQDAMFTTRASEAQLWRAPETSEARNYSWPADVFSFGVVCYEILSGELPFKGVQGAELLRLICTGKRPKIPTYCPTTVADLVSTCWATDPTARPTFAEICTKLEAIGSESGT